MKRTSTDVYVVSRLRYLAAVSALIGLAATLGFQQSAQGSPQVSANAGAAYIGSDTPAQTASSGSVSDDDSGPGDPGTARYGANMASASFGVLKASSSMTMTARPSPFPSAAFGSSTASFRDDFLIDAAGLSGTAGTVKVRFTIDGTLSLDLMGTPAYSASQSTTYAEASYAFGIAPGSGDVTKYQRARYDGTTSGTPFLGIEQEATLNFTFGQWLNDVTLRITTSAAATGEGGTYLSTATADLSHTALWGGFAEVRDSSNNLIDSFSFSSGSGMNYTQPIPEPSSAALLALAAAGLAVRRRLRR